MATSNLTLHRYNRKNKGYVEHLGDDVTLTLMLIPGGEFLMGTPDDDGDGRDSERPQHRVQVPQFLMGRYPVTQAQWRVVAGYPPVARDLNAAPSDFKGDNLPVEWVSWEDATEFCQRLGRDRKKQYQLPSEAQWEYACRGETATAYHFGPRLTEELANYDRNVGKTTTVGKFPANRWGLYDMHGNVWEWCEDDWHDNYTGAPNDGSAWVENDRTKTNRVLRGGSWFDTPRYCRSAYRLNSSRDYRFNYLGFRVCCVLPRTLLSP